LNSKYVYRFKPIEPRRIDMLWSNLTRWVFPAAVLAGTSLLTVAIFVLPELSLSVLAALVGARLMMGLVRLVVIFRLSGAWIEWRSTPRLAGTV
jgi:hypothetical protein